jgi:hypothetical protein
MRLAICLAAAAALAGCGVETVGTAATAAAVKKQEIDQGKKTMEAAQQKINDAMQVTQQRADQAGEEK